jgi:Na/Pi-cotransporter
MSAVQTFFAAVSAIILFLYALKGFSREIQEAGGPALRSMLGRVTSNKWKAFLLGAIATAVVQSSSAVSSVAVSLVDAGLLSFRASLGVVLGAKVGTTSTAWLVAFKLTGIGPFFIVAGAAISAIPGRFRIVGQGVFYFGLIFFALDLISGGLQPIRESLTFQEILAYSRSPLVGVLVGAIFTALVQSSSVTTGLLVLLVQQGLMPAESAIPVALGSNVGSTSTALLASLPMGHTAKATAMANFLLNLAGIAAVAPFLGGFARWMIALADGPGSAVALAHLCFNFAMAFGFLLLLNRVSPFLERKLGVNQPAGKAADYRASASAPSP